MIFDFDNDGFLTNRRSALEAGIERGHSDLFARARQINRDCHELLFAADIRNREVQHLLVAPLFARALEHYQATLILLGIGLVAPSKVALRATIESVFTLRAVVANDESLNAFITADLIQRLKMINRAQKFDHPNFEELREAITPELVDTVKEQIRLFGAKYRTVEELSKLAGMHDWYTTQYALLSEATHSTVRDLESYLSLNEAREVQGLIYAPSMDQVPFLLLTAAHGILIGADVFVETFELDFQVKGREHIKFIDAAFRTLSDETSLPEGA